MMLIPKRVIIEVTNSCNLRCKGCPFHGMEKTVNRPVKFLEKEKIINIINEIGELKENIDLILHGGGEPLLHKEYYEILDFAKSKNNLRVGFLTNGTFNFFPEKIVELDVDWIGFSLDGATHEGYRKIRNFNLEVVEKNINELVKFKNRRNNKKPEIYLNMVLYAELKDEKKLFVRKWINKVNAVMISKYRSPFTKNWGIRLADRKPCYHIFEELIIDSSGNVVMCCEDYNSENIIGNINNSSVLNLFNNENFIKLRRMHNNGEFEKIPICKNCETWADNNLKIHKNGRLKVEKNIVQHKYMYNG